MPPDAKFIRKYQQSNDLGKDKLFIYNSPSLIRLFQPNDFYDCDHDKNVPREFLVIYNLNKRGEVFSLSIGVGNNP